MENIIDFDQWTAPDIKKLLLDKLEEEKQQIDSGEKKATHGPRWVHFQDELSPLKVYTYLKARFGPPNGITMLGKNNASADNLIHWHYTILCKKVIINFFGHTSGLEIVINDPNYKPSKEDRHTFVTALKLQFGRYGKEMTTIQNNFECWTLFINPYVRLYQTVHELVEELEKIDIIEPKGLTSESNGDDRKIYDTNLKQWVENITKAAALGTTIRMIFPVVLEAFVNLILYTFRKKEFREDARLYDSLIRQSIDIRVKTLHINCDGFSEAIDGNETRFKNFHTLMNRRNDFLHGNIDPLKMKLEDIYFDERFTPLYEDDEGIIKRNMRKYPNGVSLQEVLEDEKIVGEFIGMVLEKLDQSSFIEFVRLMGERFLGINRKTNKLGVLLPEKFVEGVAFTNKKIEEDSDYQWYVNENGEFQIYLPITWKCGKKDGKFFFEPIVQKTGEHMICSTEPLATDRIEEVKKRMTDFRIKKVGEIEFYVMKPIEMSSTVSFPYFAIVGSQYVRFTCVIPKEKKQDSNPIRKDHLREMEKIMGSFKFISLNERKQVVGRFRYLAFVTGMAMGPLLLNNAFENKAYFEAIVIMNNQINAFLRIGIVLKKQLRDKTDEVEDKWIYHPDGHVRTTVAEVYQEARSLGVVENILLKRIIASEERGKFILTNFVLSPIPLPDVEQFTLDLYGILKQITDNIEKIEDEQTLQGVGLIKEKQGIDRTIFAEIIKSRVASDPYFESLLLKAKQGY